MLKTDGSGGTYSNETKYFKSLGSFSLEITRDPAFNVLGAVSFHIQVISVRSPARSFADRIVNQSANKKASRHFRCLTCYLLPTSAPTTHHFACWPQEAEKPAEGACGRAAQDRHTEAPNTQAASGEYVRWRAE